MKEYNREYKKSTKGKRNEYDRERKRKLLEWVWEIKGSSGCMYCPESHPAALQFHHRIPAEKEYGISYMVGHNRPKDSIMAEMAKCDIVCANCHAKLHWNDVE